MAVDAVASVVLEKLRDLLLEESFMKNKVMGSQLKEMQKALEKMRGFFMSNQEINAEQIKKWTDEYLGHLYYVENSIEMFALRITRQRKRLGFLMNHALFLKKFTACKKLSRKLERIQKKMKELNDRTSNGLEHPSQRAAKVPQKIESAFGSGCLVDENRDVEEDEEKDIREDDDDDGSGVEEEEEKRKQSPTSSVDPETDGVRSDHRRASSTPVANSITKGSERRPLSKSNKISHASFIWERVKYGTLMYSYSYNEEEQSIIGYEHRVTALRNRLVDPNDQIISVVGELGAGKTMLARAVYGNRNIKNPFKSACAWVTIFKESTTTDILHNLLKQVKKSKEDQDGMISEDSLKYKLLQELKSQKYLIVLDGVQSLDQWKGLKDAIPGEHNESKIILTTRDDQVAWRADSKKQPHRLEKLDDNESWTLFLNKAGLKKDVEGLLKERIIKVCNGLPLNIVLLGSLLSTKGVENWTSILDSHDTWQTSDIVTLSYNDLDAHLKLCLTYMTLFPKELDISVRRLQRLWLAEGFVKRPQKQDEFQEDIAQEYFENLVKRSLIMVSKPRSDGSPKTCRLLGVLHGLLFAKAQDISLFHVHIGSTCHEDSKYGKRRLIENANAVSCSFQSSKYEHLRSYISFSFQKKDTPAKDVGTLVSNMIGKGFGLLRVLDLEGVYKPSLPENLGDLFHLRYLGLRWTFLDKLPKSVGELPYLETLDLKRTYINRIPPSIWKLKHLRHLNLNEVHLDKDTRLHLRKSLPKLLTLWGLSVNHDSPVKNGLSKLTDLRELGISFCLSDSEDDDNTNERSKSTSPPQFTEDLLDWISKLTALRSLRLRSKDDSGCPADLSLKSFSGLDKLSHMNLLGKLQQLPEVGHFPPHIKVLTLSVSHLRRDQDPMPILGRLPDLTVLRLLANSYLGEKMVCPSGTFKNLEVLKLWKLDNLKEWEVGDGAMPKLKELNIRLCSKLGRIPSRLLQVETFKDLILTNMPQEFKTRVEKDQSKMDNERKICITVKNYKFEAI